MKRYKAIVIDDERNIREAFESFVDQFCPEISLCGLAGSAMEGRRLLENNQVDFIFLDISMPTEDGFAFLSSIPKDNYGVIFITAFHEYALRALKANAIDYLLKPINPHELQAAVKKAIFYHKLRHDNIEIEQIYYESLKNFHSHIHSRENPITSITVPEQFGFKIINVSDLMYLIADSNYTVLHLASGVRIVATRNLGEFERILDNPAFFRIHKSTLLNVKYLKGYISYEGNFAEIEDGSKLGISRRKLQEFRAWVKNFSVPID